MLTFFDRTPTSKHRWRMESWASHSPSQRLRRPQRRSPLRNYPQTSESSPNCTIISRKTWITVQSNQSKMICLSFSVWDLAKYHSREANIWKTYEGARHPTSDSKVFSTTTPYWFKPVVHILNHRMAKNRPYPTPAATWGHVWWPSQTLETAINDPHGTTIRGGRTRVIDPAGKEWWRGRYKHAKGM